MAHLFRFTTLLLLACLALGAPGCSRKSAEERGKEAADEKAGYVKGVGDSLRDKGREAAKSVGGGVVQVWDGFQEGVEETPNCQIDISPELADYGSEVTRIQLTSKGTVNAYLISKKPLNRSLRLKALDKDNREIGRAEAIVDFPADHAGFIDFEFDPRTPMSMVKGFEMSVTATPATTGGSMEQHPVADDAENTAPK